MTEQQSATLDKFTLEAILECYRDIQMKGFGVIRIRIENAGSTKEELFISVELEKKKIKVRNHERQV